MSAHHSILREDPQDVLDVSVAITVRVAASSGAEHL
jgi:hypothetical protein